MEQAARVINVVHQKVIVGLISVVKQVARGLLEQLRLAPVLAHTGLLPDSRCQLEGLPLSHKFIGGDTRALDSHSRRLWAAIGILTRNMHVEAVKGQAILVLFTRLVVMTNQTKRRRGIQLQVLPWLALACPPRGFGSPWQVWSPAGRRRFPCTQWRVQRRSGTSPLSH